MFLEFSRGQCCSVLNSFVFSKINEDNIQFNVLFSVLESITEWRNRKLSEG